MSERFLGSNIKYKITENFLKGARSHFIEIFLLEFGLIFVLLNDYSGSAEVLYLASSQPVLINCEGDLRELSSDQDKLPGFKPEKENSIYI